MYYVLTNVNKAANTSKYTRNMFDEHTTGNCDKIESRY